MPSTCYRTLGSCGHVVSECNATHPVAAPKTVDRLCKLCRAGTPPAAVASAEPVRERSKRAGKLFAAASDREFDERED